MVMHVEDKPLPTPSTAYGRGLVSARHAVATLVATQTQAYGGELPEHVKDALVAIDVATARATRAMLEREPDLTPQGRGKQWRTAEAPRYFDVRTDVEGVLQVLERQIAATLEDAATVTLPPATGDGVLLRELRLQERRRFLSEAERRAQGSLYASVMSAAINGDDDELLAAVEAAPRESGLRLPDDQRAKVREALVERRAPHLGTANVHASVLTSVLRQARAFAEAAARTDV